MNESGSSAPRVRTLTDDELIDGSRLVATAMLGDVGDEASRGWAATFEPARTHGAFAPEGTLVGLARWFQTRLSIPGGDVPAAAVTAVGVLPTHRREGHLTRLMSAQLEAIRAEQVPVALLVAAEWPIYGRFGYGPAVDACGWNLDATAARFRAPVAGAVELCTPAELRPHLERVHDLRWTRTSGAVTREPYAWDILAGVRGWPGRPFEPGKHRGAIWRDDAGAVMGAAAYTVHEGWTNNRPAGRAEVQLLVGATPEAERELWRHLCDIDWVRTVSAGNRGVDDPLPYQVVDGRAVTAVDHFDCIWARLLDVPASLGARRSVRAGQAVVEVIDPLSYAAGRWSVELGPDGAEVAATTAPADVTLPVTALSAAYFGGRSLRRLQEAGWLDEGAAGGIDRLDGLLSTPTAPWSPTTY